MVGEHSVHVEGLVVRQAGAYRREYLGMSSEKTGEKPVRRKPQVSPSMFVKRRLGGP